MSFQITISILFEQLNTIEKSYCGMTLAAMWSRLKRSQNELRKKSDTTLIKPSESPRKKRTKRTCKQRKNLLIIE